MFEHISQSVSLTGCDVVVATDVVVAAFVVVEAIVVVGCRVVVGTVSVVEGGSVGGGLMPGYVRENSVFAYAVYATKQNGLKVKRNKTKIDLNTNETDWKQTALTHTLTILLL